jgi:hypothetical protein
MFTQSSVADVSYPEMSFKNDTIIRNIFSQISLNAKQNKGRGRDTPPLMMVSCSTLKILFFSQFERNHGRCNKTDLKEK